MASRTRSKSGPGTMRERSPGHWQLRAFAGPDPVIGKPRQVARTFTGTEHAAAKALGNLVAEVESGKFNRTNVTVGQLLDKWLEGAERSQRPRTVYENRRKIEARIRPTLGAVRLDKLEPDTLDTAYGRWLDEGLSPATVHKYHAIVSAACNQAVKWGWIDRAPTARATAPRVDRVEMKVPTPEQLTMLVKAAETADPVLATAVALAALTGARRGEIVALKWSDIDLGNGRVRIARSLTIARGEQHTGPTKTHQIRDIALDPVCVEILKRRWAYMVGLSENAESPLVPDPYVLSYNANGALAASPDTLTHGFGKLCVAMELPALKKLCQTKPKAKRTDLGPGERWPFRFHDLRHFSVTTLIAAGVDVRTVADRHGHARATMTLDRYAHALPERDRAAAGILGAAFTPDTARSKVKRT
ncbi:MAG TPA: tyrosine-type recombinase/integrase [Acidimicrobiales bacterium]|nr:tyrosine-type recombinase/integrase [Acidimicrobiales bacterium]